MLRVALGVLPLKFFINKISSRNMELVSSQILNIKEYQEYFLGVKVAGACN
jgi:hypothetical protein